MSPECQNGSIIGLKVALCTLVWFLSSVNDGVGLQRISSPNWTSCLHCGSACGLVLPRPSRNGFGTHHYLYLYLWIFLSVFLSFATHLLSISKYTVAVVSRSKMNYWCKSETLKNWWWYWIMYYDSSVFANRSSNT